MRISFKGNVIYYDFLRLTPYIRVVHRIRQRKVGKIEFALRLCGNGEVFFQIRRLNVKTNEEQTRSIRSENSTFSRFFSFLSSSFVFYIIRHGKQAFCERLQIGQFKVVAIRMAPLGETTWKYQFMLRSTFKGEGKNFLRGKRRSFSRHVDQ